MALNLNKLKNAVANKPVDKPTGKDVAANYYARQLIDKEAKEQGAKTSALPSSADLYRQADLTGAAKGQGGQNLPSGAPVVRPAVQKSIDDYKAIDKAAETLAKHGELTEKDAETLGKARNAVMADAAAYDAVAAEQTPKMFADKVQGASERDRLNWRNMSASETAKGKDAADQGVFAGNRLTERAEDYYAHYNRILDKYSRGTATADDIKALAMEQNRLNDDRNAYTESTAGKFETAIKNAYDKSKGIGTWKDIHVGKNSAVSLPKGYNKAALDKDTDDFKAFYRDVYGKFINGKVSVSELAEVKARENELRGKNAAYYDTIDGLAEKGKEYQKNAAALALPKKRAEQIYDDAERRMHEAADLYDKVRLDTEASEEVKAKYLKDYQVADRNYRIALKNKRAADSAYEAARANIAYNDIAIEFGKYNNEYVAAKKAGYKDPADVRKNMVQAVNANADDAATYHVDDLQRYGTNEWKRIYLYLRETKGAKAANEFAKTIKPLVDVRHANISVREYEGSGFIGKVGIGVSSQVSGGLSDFGMGVVGAVKGFTGDDSYTFPTTAQSVASAVRNEEKGVVAGAAMDILRSSANMAPSIALGTFTSGAGFPMAAGVLQSLSFGLSAGGNAYIQSINEGKDAGEAFLYGAVSGASEVLLERAIGGIAGFGTSGATKFLETRAGKTVRRRLAELLSQNVNSVSDRLRVQTISALGRFISNGLSEGVEEFSQELLDPIFRNMILAEENEVFTEKNFKDALYAGAIGFINSALLDLPNEYMQSGALRNLLRGQASDTDINTVLSSPELIRDVERIFTYQLNMTTDEGGFRFSDNDIINRTFLEMLNRGAAMGTKNADNVRRAAKEAGFSENTAENASAADVASALAESINKASDSKTDLAAKEIRKDVKTDKAAEIKNEAAKRVDAIANEQLEEIRQKAQAQRIQDEEYQPIAASRGELAKFIDSRAGKEIWVDGEKRTVKGGSKGAIQTIKENGTVITDTLAGGEITYNKHGFSITGKNGTTHEFYFGKNVGIKAEKTQAAGVQKAEQAEKELAETSSIEPEKPVEDYPYNQREAIEGYADGVDDRILEFLARVRKLQDHSYRQKTNVEIAQNTERLINDVRELVGTDVTGYKHLLTGGAVEHIDKDHGQNGLSDHSMANDEDIARIGFVIENYDSVERLKDKNGKDVLDVTHQNKDSSPSRVVRFSKKINGTFYVVESVPDSKAKAMYVKSAYIQKNNSANTDEMLNVLDVRPQSPRSLRPETLPHSDSTAANDSIRGKDVGNVNENVNVLQNKTDSTAVKADAKTEIPDGSNQENTPEPKSDYVFADLPEHTVEEGKNTKTGATIYVLKLKDRVSTEDYKAINTDVRAQGSYYSRYAKGFIVPKEIFDAYTAFADGQKAVDNKREVGYNETENVNAENVKNGKEGIEDVQRREVLDGESGHDGGRLRRGITGSDDRSGNSEDVSGSRKDSGRVLQGDTVEDTSGRNGGDVSEGIRGGDDGRISPSEVDKSSSGGDGRGRITEKSGADVFSASDVSSDAEKAEKTVKDEKKAVEKVKAEKAQENAPEEVDTEVTAIAKKRPSNKENFSISDEVAAKLDRTPPNAMDNIAAIRLLKRIEDEGRPATAEEKEILAKYKGWGGIDLRNLNYEARRDLDSLFSYEQRVAMQNSSLTAYFTPTKVIDAMYTGLMRMGFKGGNILESSMGIGNFFGRMPKEMSTKSSLTGVEMESYTARIAQLLYPGATVINKPFQDVGMRNDVFDLVIGNVPFGTTKFSYGKKKYLIHNYFILSSLDKVREGGIVAVLTSAGTLDSYGIDARKAIMDKADVVACYKLPERVFSRNANTDVQTDLLILRKRAAGAKPAGDSILNVVTTEDGLRINEYFAKHSENVLGTLAKGTNAWGEITTVKGGADFYERLTAAMNKLPSGLFTGKTTLAPVESIVSVSTKPRFFEQNGAIYEDSGEGKAIKVDEKKAGVVSDYIAVRDAYKEMLDAYGKNLPETDIKPLRDKLTSVYDNFAAKHGPITGDGKKKDGAKKSANNTSLEADSDYYLVGGLEKYDEKAKRFEKSSLFEKDTLRKKQVEHVDTASDALTISLNESGKVDFKRMHELTGMSEKKLIDELSGEIIFTPDGDYVLTDIYLSGNIYEKLDAVKGKKGFEKQQEMLERAIPKPKNASEIDVKLGANYIDAKYIGDFARDIFRTRLEIGKDSAGHWSIEGARASRYGDILTVKYGLPGMNAVQLLEKILNDSEIKVMKTVNEGGQKRSVFDEEMTNVAMQKADDIREAFANWVFKSTERRNAIVTAYNRMYNNFKPVDYEKIAEKLSFDSMDVTLKAKLYPHQKRAIARALFGGDVLFAHGVGTGKTFEMIASVMEAKRMGLVNKAVMVVPKNKVTDFKKDIAGAYPNAKVLIVSTQNVKRQSMIGLVGSNDWDIVLLSRETFTKIPVSEQLQQNFVLQQLEEVQRELAEAQADRNTARRVINGLKKRSETLETKLKEIDKATKRDENSVDFEKLGIDCICVDEAHNYKSIVTPTRLNIKGLSKTGDSQRANDMLMKLDYMRTIGGKIIFGTGTPVTNTVSEIYNMTRMVCPSVLEEAGIHSLDEWVNTFGKVESTTEIDIGNNIKNKSTQIIRKFINAGEMVGLFRQFADVVFTEDVVTNLPKAKYIQVEIEGTDVHKKVMETVGSALQNAKNSEKMKVSSQVMAMATAAAADPRMLAGADSGYNPFRDYSAEELEYENSKMNKMCDITFDEYKKSNDIKGTQIIFCDSGAGSGTVYSFNLHKDIKEKLIKRGIPENEIVIVQSQSDEKLEELFRQVNDGEVRILIGTSAKMAEGLNVQRRVVAIHHPTVTFTPADLEQGNARGVRQGNMNSEVRIYNYVQGDTFDAYKWQAQARKSEMIKRALRGEAVSELEDVGDDIDPADAMAVASGNPLVKEKIDIDKEVVRLKNLQRNYLNEVYSYQDTVSKNPDLISQSKRYIANMERDIAIRDKYGEKDSIVLGGKEYSKQAEANKALANAVQKAPKDGEYKKLGTFSGFDVMFKGETGGLNYSILLKNANGYAVVYASSGNNIARFNGTLRRLDTALEKEKARLETLISDLELAKKEGGKPFEHQSALESALQKQKDITYQYEHFNEKKPETTADKAEPGSDSNVSYYKAASKAEGARKEITVSDVEALRTIGRKSVNDFTPEDIKKAEPFARRYFKELGVKSPFFRAWFGDWRAADIKGKTDISVIPEYIDSNEARKSNRGMVSNKDTGWDIKISREGETNTISHSGSDRLSEYGLAGIKQLIENAILLDCEVHEHHSNNNKIDRIAFDHKFYALGNQNRQVALYKITVEEYFQSKSEPANKKFHNLKYIEKVADLSADALSDNNRSGGSANDKSATTYSISDLYALVKAYDKDFHAKDANPELLDKNGMPKVESVTAYAKQFGFAADDSISEYRADKREADKWQTKRAESFKDSGAKVKPIPEIVDKIREKFDVPVRTGNMRARFARSARQEAEFHTDKVCERSADIIARVRALS